jgi:predicted transposase/invertase (TIGR01784 family)
MGYKPKQGKQFYQELFTEIYLYLNDYRPRHDWRAVVIYTKASFDPGLPIHLSDYAQSKRLQRLYLDRLPEEAEGRSIEVSAIQLIAAKKSIAPKRARQLIERARAEVRDATSLKDVLELINTIFVYKYPDLTRQEIEKMLGLGELKQTKVYQEAKQEGIEEGELKAKLETLPRLLALGLSVEQIAQALALPVEEVQRIVQQDSATP